MERGGGTNFAVTAIRLAMMLDRRGQYDLADRLDGVMSRLAWEQYELGLFDDRDQETEDAIPENMRRTPEHRKYMDQVRSWVPALQRSFDTDFRSGFRDYEGARQRVGEDAQPLLELNDLTRMYDALQGMSPYEIEQLTHTWDRRPTCRMRRTSGGYSGRST